MDPRRWQEIKRITADAIELEADRRAAFVAEACGSDADLRTEVERLLREHDNPTGLPGFLEPGQAPPVPWREEPPAMLTKMGTGSGLPSDGGGLASDVLKRSGERLGTVALGYAVLFFVINLINELLVHVAGDLPYRLSDHWLSQTVMMILIAISLTVFSLVRKDRIRGAAVITVGLWYEVVGTLGMALGTYAGGIPEDKRIVGVSWMCVWIVAYPFVVPSPPRKAAAAAFTSAAMGPLAIALLVVGGAYDWPPVAVMLAMFTPLFICALLASVGGRIIYRLGADLKEAQQLGSYRLERLIGRGGMGEVWVARHHMLARPAALKLMRQEMLWEGGPGGSAIELFEREAQNTAALSSPHTVELYDYGTTAEGVFYYAMELLDGLDLESLVRRFGPVPPERAIHYLEQICQSLAEAHERGLVHRDVKPANIFACRQGLAFDFIKVLDFGLVQRHRGPGAAAGGQLADREIAGTPGYMAPESLATGEASPQSDLYAVGCVGHWLLTGRHVSRESPPGDAGPQEPADRTIPPALDRIVRQCLEPEPRARPESAVRLRDQLLELAPAEPWTQERARDWWTRVAPASESAVEPA